MATAGRSPEIPDPYVGTVYGNILDMYDNPTYNLKLYVLPTQKAAPAASSTSTSSSARSDTPEIVVTAPKKEARAVVIAQTGVTGNIIDDLEIEMAPNVKGGFLGRSCKFRIFQPGAANLLDQISAATKFVGREVTTTPTMYLDITFKGYNSDPDDNDAGGEPVTILGPITYKLVLKSINVKIDNTGSNYDFECTLDNVSAFHDLNYRVPATLSSVGKTITEHVRDFEKQLNNYYREIVTEQERPDEIKFDLSGLIGGGGQAATFEGAESLKITDETLTSGNDKNAEDINRAWTNLTNETVEDEQANAEDPPKNTGRSDIIVEGDKISVKKGMSFERYFFILLSMNQQFLNMITRNENFSDPGSSVNAAKTFISWMRMNATVEELQWDKLRKTYTKRYTYKPTLYNTGRSDVALTVKELDQDAKVNAATTKLNNIYSSGKLHKSYYYLFTGHNDQIINLDISYEGAQALIVPPKGGALGDVSITSATALNSTIDQTADASGKSLFNKAKNAANKAKFGDLLSSIKDNVNSVRAIADTIGRTPEQLSGILKDTTGKAQRDLVNALDSATINKVASNAVMSNRPTSETDAPTGSTPGGGRYTPDASNSAYSEDLVTASDAIDVAELKDANIDVDLQYQIVGSSTVPNVAEAATYVTTNPGNTLFGYVYQQHSSTAFLNAINLTIRGDPWYLGKTSNSIEMNPTSTPTSMSYVADDNYFILQIASARSYDPAVDDEDSPVNSGFWKFDGMSNAFSGLYRIRTVVNNFRNGVYTVDIKDAPKEFAIPLSKIRRARPGEKVADLTSVAGYKAAAETLGTPASGTDTGGAVPDPNSPLGDASNPNLVGTPPPVGASNMGKLYDWIRAQGATPDENPNFPDPDGYGSHKGPEHGEGRAFDVNFGPNGRGVYEATDPRYAAKMDAMEVALKKAGWHVLWRTPGHYDHMHVYHYRGEK